MTTPGPKLGSTKVDLRFPFPPLALHLPVTNRCRLLGTNTPILRRAEAIGVRYDQAARWCATVGVDPKIVWADWPRDENEATLRRFWLNVELTDYCAVWRGDTDKAGYGVFCVGHRKYPAHAFILEQMVGPRPNGMDTCHSCDNPPCVAIEHLRWDTRLANVQDAIRRGRHAHGETNGHALLTEHEIVSIRISVSNGESHISVASRFGVSAGTIQSAASGKTWSHVGGPITLRPVGRPPKEKGES